ncbi:MAG: hypothetical protein AAB588_05145 [Patescibacteria group bacterium]
MFSFKKHETVSEEAGKAYSSMDGATGRGIPDPEVVEALVRTVSLGSLSYPSMTEDLPPHVLSGSVSANDGWTFVPPSRIVPNFARRARASGDVSAFWQDFGQLITGTAWKRLPHDEVMALVQKQRRAVSFSMFPTPENRWYPFMYTADASKGSAEDIAGELKEFGTGLHAMTRAAVSSVMSEINPTMMGIVSAIMAKNQINSELFMQGEMARIDGIREAVEPPEVRQAFLGMLRAALFALDIKNLAVDLLPTRSAVMYGSEGQYVPATNEAPATALVPMSEYGEADQEQCRVTRVSLDKAYEILAALIAQHIIVTKMDSKNVTPTIHMAMTHNYLAKLRGIQWTLPES